MPSSRTSWKAKAVIFNHLKSSADEDRLNKIVKNMYNNKQNSGEQKSEKKRTNDCLENMGARKLCACMARFTSMI